MKKAKSEIPPVAVWSVVVLAIAIVGVLAYNSFMKPVPKIDPTQISADRLRDPDPPRVGASAPTSSETSAPTRRGGD